MRHVSWFLTLLCFTASPLRAQMPSAAPTAPPAAAADQGASSAAAASATPPIPWRQNVFLIPFQVAQPLGRPDSPSEVQLYLSLDQGQSWRLAKRVAPQEGKFQFRAPADGEYWFAMRTLGANGLFLDNQPLSPGLRVLVDTTAPLLELRGQRGKLGEVELFWQIADQALDARTLKLEYQSAHDASWRALSIGSMQPGQTPGSAVGAASFWNGQGVGVVSIRAEVSDIAGNRTVTQTKIALDEVPANNVAPTNNLAGANPAVAPNQAMPQTPLAGPPAPVGYGANQTQNPFENRPPGSSNNTAALPPGGQAAPYQANQPAGTGQGAPRNDLPGWQTAGTGNNANSAPMGAGAGDDVFLSRPPTAQAWPADRVAQVPLEQSGPLSTGGERYFAQRNPQPTGGGYGDLQPGTQQPYPQADPNNPYQTISQQRESMPNANAPSPLLFELPRGAKLRMVNSPAFELQYDVSSLDASAVAKVELWGTRDGGKTWSLFGEDTDRTSPVPAEVKAEGIYGFSIVVHANNGKSSPTPQPGSLPEVWVGIDTTPPTGVLLGADSGENDINIRWSSSDDYPAAKPVTLAYAATPQGPWTPITTAQASQGAYTWQPGRNVPELVFIQLQVIDEAGNISSTVTQQNVALPHHRPQGRIMNVQPAPPRDPSAARNEERYR